MQLPEELTYPCYASYKNLLDDSQNVASTLSSSCGLVPSSRSHLPYCSDMKEERVAFLVPPDYSYPVAQWGVRTLAHFSVHAMLIHPGRFGALVALQFPYVRSLALPFFPP